MKKMGKTILITGCSNGIGKCCAYGLHSRGHHVFATARKEKDVKKLRDNGLNSLLLDVNDSHSIQNALSSLLKTTNHRLDVLINNCSYAQPGAVEDLTRDSIRKQFETNLFGPLELTTHVLKIMRKQDSGRIIQIGSLLGYITMPYRSAYNASKFALEGLTDTLRQELKGSKIDVSIIEPGPIHSNIRTNAKTEFLNHIHIDQSIHRKTYQIMENTFFKLDAKKPFYLPPNAVLKKVIHAIESKKPKARYYVGFPSYFFMILKRLLPASWLDRIILHILKNENKCFNR